MIPRIAVLAPCLAVPALLAAQTSPPPPPAPPPTAPSFDSAAVAWDQGNYPDALARLARLMAAPDAERHRRAVALLTGELFVTRELAPDGRKVQWSPDGRYAVIETGVPMTFVPTPPPTTARILLLRLVGDSLARVHELAGGGAVFSDGGRMLVYLRAGQPALRFVDLATLAERDGTIPCAGPLALADGGAGNVLVLCRSGTNRADLLRVRGQSLDTIAAGISRPSYFAASEDGETTVVQGGDTLYAARAMWRARYPHVVAAQLGGPGRNVLALVQAPQGQQATLSVRWLEGDVESEPRVLARGSRMAAPAISPDGRRVAYQKMLREDWEIFVANADGTEERRLTREIQHDLLPAWLTNDLLLEKIGEARHRRSYLVDVATGERTRLFHNNLLRTVSMEYAWAPSPDGRRVLIVADRDGNTISPERGVYFTDLGRQVTVADVQRRVALMLQGESDLRRRGARAFAPIAAAVQSAVADAAVARIDRYAHDLFAFDSKHITRPGNRLAIDYLAARLREWGYQPELQWFEPRRGGRTANVIATLRGTLHPELVYVVSSHFDSVEDGPGADDDASGATALLEAARVLATRPQAATIQFAFFTGEEAGLLGSREFVRRAVADSVRIVGALNNDMIGWRNDHRLDNTIRYSSDGIRDLQHAAAFQFTRLITYDSRYYQSTDAHAYYEAYGDIVGGIGSYPILGNPHYHQSHDVLETVSQELVTEVSRTTIATLMLLASSPARPTGVAVDARGGVPAVTWTAASERDVRRYVVSYGPPDDPARRTVPAVRPRAILPGAEAGWVVAIKAVNARGLESWDWARATIGGNAGR
jgi:hypothetical protein